MQQRCQDGVYLTFAVPVVFLVLPVTVLFALFPGLISIVSLAQ
jgi:tight adherence protein C